MEEDVRSAPHRIAAVLALVALTASPMTAGWDPPDAPTDGTPTFTDVAAASGISGGGSFFAWGDYDGDGDEDLLVNGNRLFRNEGQPSWAFQEAQASAFPGGSAAGSNGAWADYDNDGDLDLYVAASTSFVTGATCAQRLVSVDRWDVLWRNNGDGTFANVTVAAGSVYDHDPTGAVAWGDYDRDGWLDLFVAGAEDFYECPPGSGSYYARYFPDHLYRNRGDGTFVEVTTSALGTTEQSSPKYGRGATWADYDGDGWLDLYVTNYRQQRNYLYRNRGDGSFEEASRAGGPLPAFGDAPPDAANNPDPCNRGGHGVGSSWADYDNDGDMDLVVGTFNHKDWRTSDDTQLWRNNGDGTFTNVRAASGIPVKPPVAGSPCSPPSGNGALGDELIVGATWGDVDNDGDLDLWMPQIYDINYAYSYLYRNDAGAFADVAAAAGVRVWDTYGGAFADYDRDGDLDLVTGGRDAGGAGAPSSIHLFRNDGVAGHAWVAVALEGCGAGVNRGMVGARLRVTAGTTTHVRNVEAGQSSHSQQNSMVQHVGLGHYGGPTVDASVRLPNGVTVPLPALAVNATHALRVGCVDPVRDPVATLTGPALQDVTVSWTPPADETYVTGYAVYESLFYDAAGSGYRFLASVPKGGTSYTHAGAGKGEWLHHFYRILTNGTGTAAANPTQVAKIALTLAPGPNLVSLPVVPFDARPVAVFASLAPEYRVVRAFDARDAADPWKSHRPGGTGDDLLAVAAGDGLWVEALGSTWLNFAVTGRVPSSTTVGLRAGWNLVGYPSLGPDTVASALAGVPYDRVEGFAPNTPPYYVRALGAGAMMETGKAYWIRATADASWTVSP